MPLFLSRAHSHLRQDEDRSQQPDQESVRAFYRGWYNELVTDMPAIKDGYVYPMEGEGLCIDLLPRSTSARI